MDPLGQRRINEPDVPRLVDGSGLESNTERRLVLAHLALEVHDPILYVIQALLSENPRK